jgi:hypothetical protein
MSVFSTFCEVVYSSKLELDLEIWYDITDHDPSVGVDYEFEWEALDEEGKDRSDELSGHEEDFISKMVLQHIKDNFDC